MNCHRLQPVEYNKAINSPGHGSRFILVKTRYGRNVFFNKKA